MLEYFVYNFQTFLMMMARIFGLMTTAPVFSSDSISFATRIFFSFLITLIAFPLSANYMIEVPKSMGEYYLIVVSELFLGLLIGYMMSLIFATFQMAGEYFSVQIGFGYTEVLDPVSQASLPILSNLKNLMATLVFFVVGAHRVIIETIVLSYQKVSLVKITSEIQNGIIRTFEKLIGTMFVIAFQISLPVLGVLLLVTVAEALMGKAAPQMNVLQLSFPAKILIGLLVLLLIVPFIESQMVRTFEISFDTIQRMLREWPSK